MQKDDKAGEPAPPRQTIKCFCCDLNFARSGIPPHAPRPSVPKDWAAVDPQQYFDWHRDFGNNVMFLQAYAFGGYAFYPSKLGPVAPGAGSQLLPRLYELAKKAGMPFWSYFCVGTDLTLARERPEWVIPESAPGSCGNGRQEKGESDPTSWRKWHERGCDFFGYAWGAPPDFRPLPGDDAGLRTVREAFQAIR